MDADWTKIGALLLAALGSGLGIYNFLQARRDHAQKNKHGFAVMLLSLEPILDQITELPIKSPQDLSLLNVAEFLERLEGIEKTLNESKKDLVTLTPELAAYVIDLLKNSRALRALLSQPTASAESAIPEITLYLESCYQLSLFRKYAPDFEMKLANQTKPTVENWYGDPIVHDLVERWSSFFKVGVANPSVRGGAAR